jgi:hypothetical protein
LIEARVKASDFKLCEQLNFKFMKIAFSLALVVATLCVVVSAKFLNEEREASLVQRRPSQFKDSVLITYMIAELDIEEEEFEYEEIEEDEEDFEFDDESD